MALPDEPPESVLDLARTFGARLLVVNREGNERWLEDLSSGAPGSKCFVPLALDQSLEALRGILVYQIACP